MSNVILETTFIEKYVERISPRTGLKTPINQRSVASVDETRHDHDLGLDICVESDGKQDRILSDEGPFIATPAISLFSISETIVKGRPQLGLSDL